MEDQLSKLLAQAQKLQSDMAKLQDDLKNRTVEVSVDDGTVRVTATGNQYIKDIIIDPKFIHPANGKVLQSMVVQGVNLALEKAKNLAEKEMKKATGFSIPNFPGIL